MYIKGITLGTTVFLCFYTSSDLKIDDRSPYNPNHLKTPIGFNLCSITGIG